MGGGRRGVPMGGGLGVMLLAVALGSLAIVGDTGSGQTSLSTVPAAPVDRCGPAWVAAWQASPQAVPPTEPLAGRTLRMIVRPQVTGSQVRVRLSNRFGTTPLAVGPVSAARAGAGRRPRAGDRPRRSPSPAAPTPSSPRAPNWSATPCRSSPRPAARSR